MYHYITENDFYIFIEMYKARFKQSAIRQN